MNEVLTRERILEVAEQVLRRFGPAKTSVVDVARALGVSHGSVYRHFASKADLRDAVTEQWLKRTSDPLKALVAGDAPASEKLRQWFDRLLAGKRKHVHADPELFSVARLIFAEARDVVAAHVATLEGQIETIVAEGMESGAFRPGDAAAIAKALFDATARFHNPAHVKEWSDPDIDAAFERVWSVLMAGISA
jgi:AcrR family transcriptional regulator